MSRRLVAVLALTGVIALAVVLFLQRSKAPRPRTTTDAEAAASTAESPVARGRLVPAPTQVGSGALSLRGRVVQGGRPVAGAIVVATRGESGDSLSARECECDNKCGQRLLDCGCGEAAQQLVELVTTRLGEVVPVAEATSAADGTFELTGLEPGDVALWGEHGRTAVGLLPSVAAGREDVELVLSEGRSLRGVVVDEDDKPLSGVALTAVHKGESRFFDVLSDVSGAFTIGPVPAGAYRIVASDRTHLAEQEDYPEGDDEGRIVLADPRTVSGRVLLGEKPAVGARVELSGEHREESATTGADGAFTFTVLRPGEYEILATLDALGGSVSVSLEERAPHNVELVLEALGSLVGTVRDEGGAPIADAAVHLAIRGPRDLERKTTTGPDGTYRLPLLRGRWSLAVSHDGHLPFSDWLNVLAGETAERDVVLKASSVVAGVVVDGEGNGIANATVHLGPDSAATTKKDGSFSVGGAPGPVTLRVRHEQFLEVEQKATAPSRDLRVVLLRGAALEGVVLDADGKPVALVNVASLPETEGGMRGWKYSKSDQQGRFVLKGLQPGPLMVSATSSSDGARVEKRVVVDERERGFVELRFPKAGEISGVVVDTKGAAVASVAVLEQTRGDVALVGGHPGAPRTTTGPDGRFVLTTTSASAALVADPMQFLDNAPVQAKQGDRDVRIVVRRRAGVRGRVVDEQRRPVPSFTVDMREVKAQDGVFHHPVDKGFASPLAVGADGYAMELRPVVPRAGEEIDLGDIVLKRGRVVRGVVLDAETGAPVAGARVVRNPGVAPEHLGDFVRDADPDAVSQADGRFVLANLPESDASVGVMHDDYGPATAPIRAGDSTPTIRLKRGVLLLGRVLDAAGQGVRSVQVIAMLGRESEVWSGSDASGEFRFAGLAPGSWQLTTLGGPDIDPVTVEVPATGTVRVELKERRGGATLRVRLVAPDQADARAGVHLYRGSVSDASLTDPSLLARLVPGDTKVGFAVFSAISPGPHTLLVSAYPSRTDLATRASMRYLLRPVNVTPGEQTIDVVVNPAEMKEFRPSVADSDE